MRRYGWLALAACLLAAVPCRAAYGAVVLGVETTFLKGGKARTRAGEIVLAGDRLRAKVPLGGRSEDGEVVLVYRGDRETVYAIDADERSYYEVDRATVSWMRDQVASVRSGVETLMRGVSPETRRRIAEMVGEPSLGAEPVPTERIRTVPLGTTANVAGRPCREHAILRGRRRIGELCVAAWQAVGMRPADLEPLRRLLALQAELAQGLPASVTGGVSIDPAVLAKLDGVPVRVHVRERGHETDTRVVDVTRRDVPQSSFAPPAGWTKRSWLLQ